MAVFESQADDCPLIGIRFASSGTFFIKKTEKRLLDLGVCRIPGADPDSAALLSGAVAEPIFRAFSTPVFWYC